MRSMMAFLVLSMSFGVNAEGDHHKHDFTGDVKAFHEVLSPLWHSAAGNKRQKATCMALPNMINMAGKMKYQSAKGLVEAGTNLQRLCSADQKTFDASFSQFHDAFHKVMEEQ